MRLSLHQPDALPPFRRLALALCAVGMLAGCAGHPAEQLLANRIAPTTQGAVAAEHEIFIATTREKATNPRAVFNGSRGDMLSFARADMSVPEIHKSGQIERPIDPKVADPSRYFTALRVAGYRDEAAFRTAISRQIATHGKRALVFIHGYNTSFDAAVYRMTQIVHDSGFTGVPVLFSWPSAGRTLDYVYDNNSATAARDSLERTLRLLAEAGAERVDLVAHSMGSWVAMEALRQLAITGHRDLGGKLGEIVLASPDIDVDVFKSQMRRYGEPDDPFYILTSSNDRALTVSGLVAGRRPRVGDYADAKDLASYGITVVDITSLSGSDRLNHTKFAQNPLLIKLLGEGLARDLDTSETETGITKSVNSLAQGIGKTLESAAEIVITTPVAVLNVAVGNGRQR